MKTSILQDRYPDLEFLLNLSTQKDSTNTCGSSDEKEVKKSLKYLEYDSLEAIYIYGIGKATHYFYLKSWLNESSNRDLIFIEENIAAIQSFITQSCAEEILSHPQVHIRFNYNKKKPAKFIQALAQSFPYQSIAILSLPAYKKQFPSRFYRLRLMLMRKTYIEYAYFLEKWCYAGLVVNIASNMSKIETSFDVNGLKGRFKDIPAIICGAGPSLKSDLKKLSSLSDQALIFAGGSAITSLTNNGISPHFAVACDPNKEELQRFLSSSAFEIPLIYHSRLIPEVFGSLNCEYGYVSSSTGGSFELWMEQKIGLQSEPLVKGLNKEALSITLSALQIASTLGCNPIVFLGIDLAYTNGKAYAPNVFDKKENSHKSCRDKEIFHHLISRKDIYNQPTKTLVKWIMESAVISHFTQAHPKTQFINATSGGIGFKGVLNKNLSDIDFSFSKDLYGMVHKEIQTHPLPIVDGIVDKQFLLLKNSLLECLKHINIAMDELESKKSKNIDPETGKIIFAQMEIETLECYFPMLHPFSIAFKVSARRKFRTNDYTKPCYATKWKYLYSKWSGYKTLVEKYLGIFV